jgi:uncharacterized protein YcfJ
VKQNRGLQYAKILKKKIIKNEMRTQTAQHKMQDVQKNHKKKPRRKQDKILAGCKAKRCDVGGVIVPAKRCDMKCCIR